MRAVRVFIVALALACSATAFAGTKEDIQADMRAGRWTQADTRLDEVLAKHPDNALAHYWRAQVRLRLGQLDAARQDLADAKRLDPEHKFSADPAALGRLERELTPAPAVARVQESRPAPAPIAPAVFPARQTERASSHTGTWVVLALIALVVLMVLATRSAKRRGIDAERERLRALLNEADNDLRDAGKTIDFRAGLTPEQRLALSDRVLRAQGDIASHLSSLSTRTDLSQTHELLRRVRDVAAEVRGEERPSEIEARRDFERQQMQGMGPGMGPGPVIVQQGGSGLGTAGAVLGGVAAGAVLGSILGGSERAHAHTQDDGGHRYTPIDDFDGGDASSIDVGGSGGDWSDGGGDTGGGGGDFD